MPCMWRRAGSRSPFALPKSSQALPLAWSFVPPFCRYSMISSPLARLRTGYGAPVDRRESGGPDCV
jgi:hypothetical protein